MVKPRIYAVGVGRIAGACSQGGRGRLQVTVGLYKRKGNSSAKVSRKRIFAEERWLRESLRRMGTNWVSGFAGGCP